MKNRKTVTTQMLALGFALCTAACGGGTKRFQDMGTPQPTRTEDAFGDLAGVNCSAVRPKTEPDLMAWDPGSRMSLNTLRKRGIVAVRYVADGCNVELELIPNCIGEGEYEYEPYASTDSRVVTNKQELFGEFPLGAARLAGKLQAGRALRTDYTLVGMDTLPVTAVVRADQLSGPGCEKATHVISRIYLGGFGMVSGDRRTLQAAASVFGAGLGASASGNATRDAYEGNPEHCERALATGKEEPLCSAPLRIGLSPIGAPLGPCPAGTVRKGDQCVSTAPQLTPQAALVKLVWNGLGMNSTNACPTVFDYGPHSGLRGLGCHVLSFTDYVSLQEMSGLELFLSGPHSANRIVLEAKYSFGHYNPEFVKWAVKALKLAIDTEQLAQSQYDTEMRQLARTLEITWIHLQENPRCFIRERDRYLSLVKSQSLPYCYHGRWFLLLNPEFCSSPMPSEDYLFENGFDGSARIEEATGTRIDGNVVKTCAGFWFRRNIDGTDEEFHEGLQAILRKYDEQFWRLTQVDGVW